MTTLGGIDIVPTLFTARLTVCPPGPAGLPIATTNVPVLLRLSVVGLGIKVMALEVAVIITVAGALLTYPSLTINCATYVPGTSATKMGDTVVAPLNVALLPEGLLVSDQA